MILYEFDEEEYKVVLQEDAFAEGQIDAIFSILGETGTVPSFLSYKLFYFTTDERKELVKLAARVNTVEEFVEKMNSVRL